MKKESLKQRTLQEALPLSIIQANRELEELLELVRQKRNQIQWLMTRERKHI